ncbi:MAG: VWA domain-containing protein [Flavobacteriales bacterium]|nr:VWA domain-containing protein [Flavobacteriales bacterium]
MRLPRTIAPAICIALLGTITACVPPSSDRDGGDNDGVDSSAQVTGQVLDPAPATGTPAEHIMLGLILDTSNSMDGLIDQAKSQLWNIVNKLSSAHSGDQRPSVQVALYEYGNDRLSGRTNHIRQVSGFTTNMDEISKALFALTTDGGEEYCGAVIARSVDELPWGEGDGDLRMLVIAGNEPFTQGPVNFGQACERARQKGIVVNTIYCGEHNEGINSSWQAGAIAAAGDYFSIDQNAITMQIASPYDDELAQLEMKWNASGIFYGAQGGYNQANLEVQDSNGKSLGKSTEASRRSYKLANSHLKQDWDLTEVKAERLEEVIKGTDKATLPPQYRALSEPQLKAEVERSMAEKERLKDRMAILTAQREAYISTNSKTSEGNELENALLASIEKHAAQRGLHFGKVISLEAPGNTSSQTVKSKD